MAEIKKYLDQEGVALLWSKINMQDYPNNKTLISIIEAIDETKADKLDLNTLRSDIPTKVSQLTNDSGYALKTEIPEQVQADWDQTDEAAVDFVKNKTHGTVMYAQAEVASYTETTVGSSVRVTLDPVGYLDGKRIRIHENAVMELKINDTVFSTNLNYITKLAGLTWGYYDGNPVVIRNILTSSDTKVYIVQIDFTLAAPAVVSAQYKYPTTQTLDEKYIPDTIARKTDIPEQIQADWNQIDESAIDYIKNKPQEVSEDEFLVWLNEENIVSPMASAAGELYVTNNNEIYVL